MKKRGRKVGWRKEERRKKMSITQYQFWIDWLNKQKILTGYSQSQTIQRALEDYREKIEMEADKK